MEILLSEMLYVTIPLVAVAALFNLCLFVVIVTRRHLRTNWFYWLVLAKAVMNVFHSGIIGPMTIDSEYSKTWKLGETGCVADTFIFQTVVSFELLVQIAMMVHLIVQHLQCCKSQATVAYNVFALALLVVTAAASLTAAGVTTRMMEPQVASNRLGSITFCDFTIRDITMFIDIGICLVTVAITLATMVMLCVGCQKTKKLIGTSTTVFLVSLVTVALHLIRLSVIFVDLPRFIPNNIYWGFHAIAILFAILWILDSQIRPKCCRRTSKKPYEPTTA